MFISRRVWKYAMASRFKFKILNKAHFKLIFSIKRDDNRKNAAEFSVKICKICQKPLNSPVLSNNKADAKHRQTWRHKTAKSTKTIYLNRDEKDFYQFQKAILRRFWQPKPYHYKADCRLFRSLLCQIYSAKEFVLISSAQNLTKCKFINIRTDVTQISRKKFPIQN